MKRFFVEVKNILEDKIIIKDKEKLHYLKDVLRLKPKEKVIIFTEGEKEYLAEIEKVLPYKIILGIKETKTPYQGALVKLTVACALAKKSKMDEIIDKLTQLGVERIIPIETERTVVKLDKEKKIIRLKRWQKIALNSSQQSQRSKLPIIEPIKDIKELLKEKNYDLKLIPTLEEKGVPLKEILSKIKPKNILVLIGPEGDFSPCEVKLAKIEGFIPVSLGDLVLRVETAAVSIVSILSYVFSTNYHESSSNTHEFKNVRRKNTI